MSSVGRTVWDLSLTDLGKKSMRGVPYAHKVERGCDYWQVSLPFATKEEIRVTGIKQSSNVDATADFAFRWKLNDLGKLMTEAEVAKLHLSEKDIDGMRLAVALQGIRSFPLNLNDLEYGYFSAHFEKYDDGWRLKL